MYTLATIILSFASLNVYVCGESYFVCNQTEAAYPLRKVPANRGDKGEKGQIGLFGQKGERGIVNYARIDAAIRQHIRENMAQFGKEKVEADTGSIKPVPAACPIPYKNRCYVPVVDTKVNKYKAEKKCARMSGRLANIYDKEHFDFLVETIRSKYMAGQKFIEFRIGMSIFTEIQLTDGRIAPPLRWFPTFPYIEPDASNIILQVRKARKNIYQYLYQMVDSYDFYTLCEITF